MSPAVTAETHVCTVTTGTGELRAAAGAQAQSGLVGGVEAAGLGVVVDSPLVRSQQESGPLSFPMCQKVRVSRAPSHPQHQGGIKPTTLDLSTVH